jgi:hypothetical protein
MTCMECGIRETSGTHKLCFECNPAPHGEERKYSAGCRCEECRSAAHKQDLVRASSYETSRSPHGSPQKYRNGCRCDLCVLASRRHRTLLPHGMPPETYDALLAIESGACPICGVRPEDVSEAFHIDHRHGCEHPGRKISCSECWRGLLCQICNPNLERKVGHAYLREIEGLPPTDEDVRVLEYIRNPPANQLRNM